MTKCPDCNGTRTITLFTSVEECQTCKPKRPSRAAIDIDGTGNVFDVPAGGTTVSMWIKGEGWRHCKVKAWDRCFTAKEVEAAYRDDLCNGR